MSKAYKTRPRDFNQAAKLVVDIATGQIEDPPSIPEERGKDPTAAASGRKGGKARASQLSEAARRDIAQKAARTCWERNKKNK